MEFGQQLKTRGKRATCFIYDFYGDSLSIAGDCWNPGIGGLGGKVLSEPSAQPAPKRKTTRIIEVKNKPPFEIFI